MRKPKTSPFFCYCSIERCTSHAYSTGLCQKHYNKKNYSQNREKNLEIAKEYRNKNKERIKTSSHRYYQTNKVQICTYKKKYRLANKEIIRRQHSEYYLKKREIVRAKQKEWYLRNKPHVFKKTYQWRKNNKEKVQAMSRSWTKRNIGKCSAKCAARRALKIQRTPVWLTKVQLKEIETMYKNRPDGYEADHIVPLQGLNVSGLHVPWNLQYLTAKENRSKGNRYG